MFTFKPSAGLARAIFDHLRASVTTPLPEDSTHTLETLREQLEITLWRGVAAWAQRARHKQEKELVILEDGAFPSELEERIFGSYVPEGAAGDEIIKRFAEEFFLWMKNEGRSTTFAPRGPIQGVRIEGKNIIALLRPLDPQPTNDHPV